MVLAEKPHRARSRTESLEINPCIYGQLIYNKGARIHSGERIVSSINGVGENEE